MNPEWEDPRNTNGCDIHVRKSFDYKSLKTIWDRVVFNVIGESLETEQELVGCRILNRPKFIKIEFWLTYDAMLPEFNEKATEFKAKLLE